MSGIYNGRMKDSYLNVHSYHEVRGKGVGGGCWRLEEKENEKQFREQRENEMNLLRKQGKI